MIPLPSRERRRTIDCFERATTAELYEQNERNESGHRERERERESHRTKQVHLIARSSGLFRLAIDSMGFSRRRCHDDALKPQPARLERQLSEARDMRLVTTDGLARRAASRPHHRRRYDKELIGPTTRRLAEMYLCTDIMNGDSFANLLARQSGPANRVNPSQQQVAATAATAAARPDGSR